MAADWRTTFAKQIADQTGLNFKVVYAWTLAEDHGDNRLNPLNIMRPLPSGGQEKRVFANTAAAAKATANLINSSSNYAGIRRAAKSGDPSAQIEAIGASPWGTLPRDIRGAYASLKGSTVDRVTGAVTAGAGAAATVAGGVVGAVVSGKDSVGDVVGVSGVDLIRGATGGAVGDAARWAEKKALLALLYVTLTLLALLLVLGGLTRTTGLPLPVMRLGGGGGKTGLAAAEGIPF